MKNDEQAVLAEELRRVDWEGTEDQQAAARKLACDKRCQVYGYDQQTECAEDEGIGNCSECDISVADILETKASMTRRKKAAKRVAELRRQAAKA